MATNLWEIRLFVVLPLLFVLGACQPNSTSISTTSQTSEKGMEKFANDKEFHATHTMQDAAQTKLGGSDIEIAVAEGKAKGYWVAPKADHQVCILMVHEWWGLNENIRQTADMINRKAGYGVLAIDLYEGKVAKKADEAGKYMGAVDQKRASATINAAIRALNTGLNGSKPASKVGTIGFCFGGGWSHKAAIMGGKMVQACIIFYGLPTTAPGELERLSAPVLMVWGTKDKWINKQVVTGFESAMKTADKQLQVEEFDADHAFANPTSKSFKSEASQQAWDKTFEFFKKNLG